MIRPGFIGTGSSQAVSQLPPYPFNVFLVGDQNHYFADGDGASLTSNSQVRCGLWCYRSIEVWFGL